MPVIAVLNRKGGSGKSTLASNIAAWCASRGWHVMLGDVDRQRSMKSWLQRRRSTSPAIQTWAIDNGRMLRAPRGVTHVVLDTPGALYDHDLAKLLVSLDAVVVPIGPSIFDRDASLDFLTEISKLPRISSGRCKLIAVGMRWPIEKYEQWLSAGRQWDWPLLTVIPDANAYRTCLENGESVFDPQHGWPQDSRQHWEPLMAWLEQFWSAVSAADAESGVTKAHLAHAQVKSGVVPPLAGPAPTPEVGPLVSQFAGRVNAALPEVPAYLLRNGPISLPSNVELGLSVAVRTVALQSKVLPAGPGAGVKVLDKRGWLGRWFVS